MPERPNAPKPTAAATLQKHIYKHRAIHAMHISQARTKAACATLTGTKPASKAVAQVHNTQKDPQK
jgi:hypothetical protein